MIQLVTSIVYKELYQKTDKYSSELVCSSVHDVFQYSVRTVLHKKMNFYLSWLQK